MLESLRQKFQLRWRSREEEEGDLRKSILIVKWDALNKIECHNKHKVNKQKNKNLLDEIKRECKLTHEHRSDKQLHYSCEILYKNKKTKKGETIIFKRMRVKTRNETHTQKNNNKT